MNNYIDNDDFICALATPWLSSAIAVIRTSGDGCIEKIAEIFSQKNKLLNSKTSVLIHGVIFDNDKTPVDDVLLSVFRNPKSYTGQDSVEISCHGSLPGIKRILETLKKLGFRDAAPGEFTRRAFLNGKLDLTRAEAVQEIVGAKSTKAQNLALNRLSGAIEKRINKNKNLLKNIMAQIEIQLDYPEEDLDDEIDNSGISLNSNKVLKDLGALVSTYRTGKIFQEGVKIVLAGKTNAGKSALFNLFLKEDRSIVSEIHGTTRDYIESWISIKGLPVRIFDTAGIRFSEDIIETEGIRRTEKIIQEAEIILYIIDSVTGLSVEDEENLKRFHDFNSKVIFVWNKVDLKEHKIADNEIALSAETGQGFHLLEDKINEIVFHGEGVSESSVVIDSLRQKELLDDCIKALNNFKAGFEDQIPFDAIAMDLKEALDSLGQITGEVSSADIFDAMFSSFCVGK